MTCADLMEIVHTGLLNAATISHPSTQVTKLHKDSQQSHTSPVISNINDEVPLVVNSNKPDEPNDPYDLSSMTAKLFPTLVNMLLHETHLSKETRILIAKAIKEKYRKSKDGPKRTAKRSCKPYPSNAHEMKYLLYGPPRAPGDVEVREDDQHRWRILPGDRLVVTISLNDPHRNSIMPGLFLRCFDNISISQCTDPRGGFNAGSPDKALVTRLSRRTELRNHTYWPNRTKTPFVSVTTHPSFIYELIDRFKERTAKTGLVGENFPGQVVIINGFAQTASGFPLLRIVDEMDHYKVNSLYGPQSSYGDKSFYENEWIAPYSVVNAAIVRAYYWRDIERWLIKNKSNIWSWYLQVAVPDFQAHEKERQDKITKSAETKKRLRPVEFDATDSNSKSGPASRVEQETIPDLSEQR